MFSAFEQRRPGLSCRVGGAVADVEKADELNQPPSDNRIRRPRRPLYPRIQKDLVVDELRKQAVLFFCSELPTERVFQIGDRVRQIFGFDAHFLDVIVDDGARDPPPGAANSEHQEKGDDGRFCLYPAWHDAPESMRSMEQGPESRSTFTRRLVVCASGAGGETVVRAIPTNQSFSAVPGWIHCHLFAPNPGDGYDVASPRAFISRCSALIPVQYPFRRHPGPHAREPFILKSRLNTNPDDCEMIGVLYELKCRDLATSQARGVWLIAALLTCLIACEGGDAASSGVDAGSDVIETADDATGDAGHDAEVTPVDGGAVIIIPDAGEPADAGPWDAQTSPDGPTRPDGVAPTPAGPGMSAGTSFTERTFPEVSDHLIAFAEGDYGFGYSVGGGLLDFDGDLDIDIFLGSNGSSGTRACLYENLLEEGELRFRCRHPMELGRKLTGAWAFDMEDDGIDEMILVGTNWATIERFYPARERMDLLSLAELDVECTPAAVSVMDYDYDGVADILLGCRSDNGEGIVNNTRRNHLFVGDGSGEFRWVDPTITESEETFLAGLLVQGTNTLALSQTDVNGDGLLDLHVINDTFSSPDSRRTTANSGGVFLSCRPDESCRYRRVTYGEGATSWGSFMAIAMPWVNNLGFAYFLADWGPNRLLAWRDGKFTPHAESHNLEIRGRGQQFNFTWGAIAADFNFDGNDDVFVSQGSMLLGNPSNKGAGQAAFRDQRDVLMVQDATGIFHQFGSSVGIPIPDFEAGSGSENQRGSRASAFVDFDLDGVGEIFLLPYLGFVKVLSEQANADHRRCTLIPRSRYVPVSGEGYMVRSDPSGQFRSRQMQGHMQLGMPNAILVEGTSGDLQFPSGAVVPWACSGDARAVVVEEPEWLMHTFQAGSVQLSISSESWPAITNVSAFVRGPGEQLGSEREALGGDEDGDFTLSGLVPGSQFMLRIDGQIVGRWFDVSESEE